MLKTCVVYKSKYGATERYAKWLSGILKCEMIAHRDLSINRLNDYDIIVYGGGVYAGMISGISYLKKNILKLQDKKIICFAVGAMPLDEKMVKELEKNNLKEKLSNIPLYYCRGELDESKLGFIHKKLIGFIKKMGGDNPIGKAIVSEDGVNDWIDIKYLEPVIRQERKLRETENR